MQSLALDSTEKAALLARSGVFGMHAEEALHALADLSEVYAYDADEVVFEKGSIARELYVVRNGTVAISQDGREIARYVAGEAFGEMDLLGQAGRAANARMDGDGHLLVFPQKAVTFKTVLRKEPGIAATVMHSLLSLVAGRIREANRLVSESSPWVRKLRAELYTDKLTGLYTRSFIDDELPSMIDPDSDLCIVMVKPDNFKEINDTFGHSVGDAALARMAATFRLCLDDADLGVRYLGNEFAAIFPHAQTKDCSRRAAEIFDAMNSIDLSDILGENQVRLSFSAAYGCAISAEDPVELAHDRLFEVRSRGPSQLYE